MADLSSAMGLAENRPTIILMISGNTMALANTNTEDNIKSEEFFRNKLNFPAIDKPMRNNAGAANDAARA